MLDRTELLKIAEKLKNKKIIKQSQKEIDYDRLINQEKFRNEILELNNQIPLFSTEELQALYDKNKDYDIDSIYTMPFYSGVNL